MKQRAGIENEDDEEEEEEEKQSGWGRGKKIYYNADNVDFEVALVAFSDCNTQL